MNKYLVTIIIPQIDAEFDLYIPNNKKVGTIKKFILEALKELSNGSYNKTIDSVRMLDREYGIEYDNDIYVQDSKIRNNTKLILM